jgi:hypothetical protein
MILRKRKTLIMGHNVYIYICKNHIYIKLTLFIPFESTEKIEYVHSIRIDFSFNFSKQLI